MELKFYKWTDLLLNIEQDNLSRICFRLDVTYSHATKIVEALLKEELISVKKEGRNNRYQLTERGRAVCRALLQIKTSLSERSSASRTRA